MIEVFIKKKLVFASGNGHLEVNLSLQKGDFLAITGSSGSGKTTLLRTIAGLETADEGRICMDGNCWWDQQQGINLAPQKRRLGYVFQGYALFPNMTVRQQLEFAKEKKQEDAIVTELLEEMELNSLADQYPYRLSGGQQQRVALARALVRRPEILLLDEPLSALDYQLRQRLQSFILKVHQRYQLTTILVSHNQAEIQKMANRLMVLSEGKITRQKSIANDMFARSKNLLKGKVVNINFIHPQKPIIILAIGANSLPVEVTNTIAQSIRIGDMMTIEVAPEGIKPVSFQNH